MATTEARVTLTDAEREVVAILAYLADNAKWQENNQTRESVEAKVKREAKLIEDIPRGWALNWVIGELKRGKRCQVVDAVTAWRAERFARISSADLAVTPDLPDGIELGTPAAAAWERARRNALVAGATAREAVTAADRAVGSTRPAPPSPDQVAAAKARARANFAAWQAAQAREQTALESEAGRGRR